MSETTTEKQKKKTGVGALGIIGISIVYILLGLAMIFFPQFNEIYIIYCVCAVLIIVGILMIVRYFTSGSFKNLQAYGFSFGVLAIVGGFCILIRSQLISEYFGIFLGICVLLTAVIKLQNAVDLGSMENRTWIIFLVLALIFLAAAVGIILDPFGMNRESIDYIYYILVADGAVGIFSSVYMIIANRIYGKWEAQGKPERGFEKRRREREEEAARKAAEEKAAAERAEAEREAAPLSIEEKEQPAESAGQDAAGTSSEAGSQNPGSSQENQQGETTPSAAGSENPPRSAAQEQPADRPANEKENSAKSASAAAGSSPDDTADDDDDTSINARILKSIFSNNDRKS